MAKKDPKEIREELGLTIKLAAAIPAVQEAEYFRPTAKQRKLKAAFLMSCKSVPNDPSLITLDLVKQYVKTSDIDIWWPVPGFATWFRRAESVSERLNYLFHLRLDAITEILESEDEVFTARDKIAAGAELDKIARTVVEAADALEKASAERKKTPEELAEEAFTILKRKKEDAKQQAAKDARVVTVTMPEMGNSK
jgi:hypothetical protein